MAEAMSKKERLARGSAVIKVMKVIPRPGKFLKSFIDVRKLPKAPKVASSLKSGVLTDMPWLDVKNAIFKFEPNTAKIVPGYTGFTVSAPSSDPCAINLEEDTAKELGLPDGSPALSWFGYREWARTVSPTDDRNLAAHFNVLLGLLMSMAVDPENEEFPDEEAYPCLQFLRTITTPDGEVPYNTGSFITYIEYICNKIVEEG